MYLPQEVENYRNEILANPPKVPAKIKDYWRDRIVPANLYSLGEMGAYKYITRCGGRLGEKTLVHYALQAQTEKQADMARGFWKKAYEARMKKGNRTMKSPFLNVFLCHSSNDKMQVRDLFQKLRSDGFDPWLDEEKILPGQDWQLEIAKAVRSSDVVLVCLSRASTTKIGYVQKELRYALDVAEEQPEGYIFIIPVKLEECLIPERLRKLQWVELFRPNGYDRLLLSLKARANTRRS